MDSIIFEIKDQLFYTITLAINFFKVINLSTFLLSLGLLYIVVLRKWALKKIGSFFLIIFLLFILMIRTEAYFTTTFGADSSSVSIGVCRTVFLIIAALVFIYYAAIKE
ncbi:MAG: hypothetical protein HZB36_01955 [Candidatus Omnitrophica bacterium]|nr:hypothetical protein [Candidatus Omnitrophota bacterium]